MPLRRVCIQGHVDAREATTVGASWLFHFYVLMRSGCNSFGPYFLHTITGWRHGLGPTGGRDAKGVTMGLGLSLGRLDEYGPHLQGVFWYEDSRPPREYTRYRCSKTKPVVQ